MVVKFCHVFTLKFEVMSKPHLNRTDVTDYVFHDGESIAIAYLRIIDLLNANKLKLQNTTRY
jgi:hypothetical protein